MTSGTSLRKKREEVPGTSGTSSKNISAGESGTDGAKTRWRPDEEQCWRRGESFGRRDLQLVSGPYPSARALHPREEDKPRKEETTRRKSRKKDKKKEGGSKKKKKKKLVNGVIVSTSS